MSKELDTVEVSIRVPFGKSKRLSTTASRRARVQSIMYFLAFNAASKYYTNYELLHNGVEVDEQQLISELAGNEQTVHLQLRLKPYNTGEVIRHFVTFREYIGFVGDSDDDITSLALSNVAKFRELPLTDIAAASGKTEVADDRQKEEFQVSDAEKAVFTKELDSILELRPSAQDVLKGGSALSKPCLRSLIISGYNPVPAFFRTKGHLLYLQAVTLEGETLHITATVSGFYVNKSSAIKFDPTLKTDAAVCLTLYELLTKHSKKFASHLSQLEAALKAHESVNYVKPISVFLHKTWFPSSLPSNSIDFTEYQLEALNFQTERNFNDEFQAVKETSSEDIVARLEKEKLLNRVIHDFNVAASKGSMEIFYGNMVAMNPDAPRQEHIFLKNNIFYSFVSDLDGHYQDKGGDAAAHAASNQDLHIIKTLLQSNMRSVRHLLTAVVEFGGVRILAQSPVPGILDTAGMKFIKNEKGEEEAIQAKNDITVCYGFDEASNKVIADAEFGSSLDDFAKVFHLKKHEVDGVELKVASTSKGVVGFDKRNYILDLADNNPLDVGFALENFDAVTDEKARYPHRQTLLRRELVEKWWFSKVDGTGSEMEAAYEEGKFSYNPDAYKIEGIEDETVVELSDYLRKEVVPTLVKEVAEGSITAPFNGEHLVDIMHKNGINIRYLGRVIELAEQELEAQRALREAHLQQVEADNKEFTEWEANYLKHIESLIKERQVTIQKLLAEGKEVPAELKEELKLDDKEIRKPHEKEGVAVNNDQLSVLLTLAQIEIISRSIKHVFRKHCHELPAVIIPTFIAFALNLLFGYCYNKAPIAEFPTDGSDIDFAFTKLTREQLLSEISEQAVLRFRYTLPDGWESRYEHTPFALLRPICNKFGIQLLNKEYFFTREQYQNWRQAQDKKIRSKLVEPVSTFSINDLSVRPIIKVATLTTGVSDDCWAQGAYMINEEEKQATALALFSQSIAFREETSGYVHPTVAESYLALSTIHSKLEKKSEAVALCRKACAIYERVCGFDSFEMIRSLNNLAMLEMANDSPYNAALCLKTIMSILSVVIPVNHPATINSYSMLHSMCSSLQNSSAMIKVLNKLGDIIVEIDGHKSLPYAVNESRLANLYASVGEYKRSLACIESCYELFSKELGVNHKTTVECNSWITGVENLIESTSQSKALAASKAAAAAKQGEKKPAQKQQQSAELRDKSIDELMNFINGGSAPAKKSKKKKNAKK
ncbi:ABR050Wp [Eremothecium gossypii ATCC 10895]|uniref:Clustered mitochondria protein homolog n=1 Tax=Eremothecium gossypii (strain ATCC 10895 / CBS 109.51 / FGSC 9923 / NRRL Y-1056) TaxID=284811 RepID=CLU_EREGS|nr:ABR050Wp [Eremothecium gossypii ATCC 10895]Q75DR9.2 RecName: Full=Clustered mitochondria protein homolog; AltName: Full=Protein TIF31 homolog [Eremothecium gossypii ATCC 10895]AAS50820.2 ABR050Wp [Eremothecium gossypii ATCC 10895]AEY95109.1 FABR050Wp [Eremothecium gossypii FDAG1]